MFSQIEWKTRPRFFCEMQRFEFSRIWKKKSNIWEKKLKYLRKKLKLKSWQLRVVSHLGQYLNSRKYLFNIWHYWINFTKKQKLIRLFGILSMFIRLENDYKYISFMFLNMHVFEAIRIMMNWFHANNTCSKNGWNLFSITNSDISEKFSVNVWLLQFIASPSF